MRLSAIAITLAVLVAALTLQPTPNAAVDRVCDHPTSAEVRALYERWEMALRDGDVEALTALYSPDAILMGPGAPSIRIGHGEIAAYYTAFVRHAPAAQVTERVVRTDCGAANDIGLETVMFGSPSNGFIAPARYSFSYVRAGWRWLIVHHHQEVLEPIPGDITVAVSATTPIVTGANPTLATPSTPSVSPPPSDANRRMQFLLPLQRSLEPPPSIDVATLDRLLALVPPAEVVLPEPAFAIAAGAPSIEPAPARVISAPLPRSTAIDIPAPPFTLAAAPPALVSVEPETERRPEMAMDASRAPSARTEPRAPPTVTVVPSVPVVKPLPKPAVAGFAQRLPAPPLSIVQIAARPAAAPARTPVNAARPLPVQSTIAKEPTPRTGRFLRWDESTPIFDD